MLPVPVAQSAQYKHLEALWWCLHFPRDMCAAQYEHSRGLSIIPPVSYICATIACNTATHARGLLMIAPVS